MIGLDKLQVLTFLMGVIVVTAAILAWTNPTIDQNAWHRLIDLLQTGLAFYFVAYSIAVNIETTGKGRSTRGMYTAFLVLTSLASWLIWIISGTGVVGIAGTGTEFLPLDSTTDNGWNRVANQVARPLALGSLFVLPYVFTSFN